MQRFITTMLVILIAALGVWVGSRVLGNNQKVYHTPEQYTEKVQGLDGIKVR